MAGLFYLELKDQLKDSEDELQRIQHLRAELRMTLEREEIRRATLTAQQRIAEDLHEVFCDAPEGCPFDNLWTSMNPLPSSGSENYLYYTKAGVVLQICDQDENKARSLIEIMWEITNS